MASLRPTTDTPNVRNTNELQSLNAYIDEQREQMQHIVGGIQKDYKRLVCSFDKSTIATFPSHEVELGENTRDSSATGCHDQSQPLYGMTIDTYPGQPQPPTHISDKFANLRMSKPSARERGPSGPTAAGPIFRNELPKPAPEPPRTAQTLDNPFGPSVYGARQSPATWPDSPTRCRTVRVFNRTAWHRVFFEEDGYPTPQPSQLNFSSHHTTHQHHNIIYQTREGEYFSALRRPERNGQLNRASINTPQNPNQWGGRPHTKIQTTSPMFD
jgi:hypothetical protein